MNQRGGSRGPRSGLSDMERPLSRMASARRY
jgi:hypothetical protein